MRYLGTLAAFAVLSAMGAASAPDIRATVDGNLVNFPDVQPQMVNSRVMVPIRGVFEHMEASVEWDESTRSVIAKHGNDTIKLPVNSYTATVNGNQVRLDSPATNVRGRTMVPLRFLSESLHANVEWVSPTRTVEILTTASSNQIVDNAYSLVRLEAGTVIPFELSQKLSSNGSDSGDLFKAKLDTNGSADYQGLPAGSILEGYVDVARAKSGNTPGVLGLAFDRVKSPDGQGSTIFGSLIGLDEKSIVNENGRLVARPGSKNDDLKYVGIGAAGGALVSILTKGNLLTETLIGGALGYIFGRIQKDPSEAKDVNLATGTKFGVRLDKDFTFRVLKGAQ